MEKPIFGIFGHGGFGREGIVLAQETCLERFGSSHHFELCFVEHNPTRTCVDGFRVYSLVEFSSLKGREKYFNVLISENSTRRRIVSECENLGLIPFSIKSRTAEIHPTA